MQITLDVNGESRTADVDEDTPLLWVLRETLGLTGTKFGCGVAACGACTVHVNGTAVRSCSVPASAMQGQAITTIEGLAPQGAAASAAGRVDRAPGAAMRLLPVRHDHGGRRAARAQSAADRRGDRRGSHQHLPLRHLRARAPRDPFRRAGADAKEARHEQVDAPHLHRDRRPGRRRSRARRRRHRVRAESPARRARQSRAARRSSRPGSRSAPTTPSR